MFGSPPPPLAQNGQRSISSDHLQEVTRRIRHSSKSRCFLVNPDWQIPGSGCHELPGLQSGEAEVPGEKIPLFSDPWYLKPLLRSSQVLFDHKKFSKLFVWKNTVPTPRERGRDATVTAPCTMWKAPHAGSNRTLDWGSSRALRSICDDDLGVYTLDPGEAPNLARWLGTVDSC